MVVSLQNHLCMLMRWLFGLASREGKIMFLTGSFPNGRRSEQVEPGPPSCIWLDLGECEELGEQCCNAHVSFKLGPLIHGITRRTILSRG